MENASCYNKKGLKKGAWSKEEDDKLRAYIHRYGHWNWGLLPRFAGVSRTGKSCRLRWMNYLRPNMKHGNFTEEEDNIIVDLRNKIGNKWSTIASKLPGRSDNEVKNRWNTHLKKRVQNDQTFQGSCEIIGALIPPDDQANPKVNLVKGTADLEHQQELESCESPSSSSSTTLLSCWLHGGIEYCTDSSELTPAQTFVDEMVGDFWTDPFLQDNDRMIIPSEEILFSPFNYMNDFISQSSCQNMIMNDDFVLSNMDTYVEDNILWNS